MNQDEITSAMFKAGGRRLVQALEHPEAISLSEGLTMVLIAELVTLNQTLADIADTVSGEQIITLKKVNK
jgi:hypothetical protein